MVRFDALVTRHCVTPSALNSSRLAAMANWNITSGPRRYSNAQDDADIDVGWSWTIERAAEQHLQAINPPTRIKITTAGLLEFYA